MDDYEDIDAFIPILPGVDLALWLRIVVSLTVCTLAVALTLTLR